MNDAVVKPPDTPQVQIYLKDTLLIKSILSSKECTGDVKAETSNEAEEYRLGLTAYASYGDDQHRTHFQNPSERRVHLST